MTILFLIIIAFVVIIFASKKTNKEEPHTAQTRITEEFIALHKQEIIDDYVNHLPTLEIKKSQLIYVDDYGDEIEDDWEREKIKFINKKMNGILQLLVSKAKNEFDSTISLEGYKPSYRKDIYKYIEDDIQNEISYMIEISLIDYEFDKVSEFEQESEIIYNLEDPILFEKSVAENFDYFGWITKETKTTGDQGADVVADKNGVRIIVQCKLYSSPVGNKAVQEVFSANQFYKGDIALVVSNASYTKSAKQLADSTDVLLIHYSQVSEFINNYESSKFNSDINS